MLRFVVTREVLLASLIALALPSLVPAAEEVFEDPQLAFRSQSCDTTSSHGWADNLELFLGLEGSKQPQDFGVNAQFGGRAHVNWAIPLLEEFGLGLQVGTSINQTKHAVAVTHAIEGSSSRTQNFTTIGVFQRTDNGWTWGLAHDFLYQNDYDSSYLTQWRGRAGYAVTDNDEIGIMAMVPQTASNATWAGVPVRLKPLAMGSGYWRHSWAFGAQTTGWLGMADRHGQANVALGDRPSTGNVVVFGADLQVPLNDHWALFGEANFVTPADTGTVDAYLGFSYYPGGGALRWRNRAFAPVLPVANNTSFVTNLVR
jgi:hypothetical protein